MLRGSSFASVFDLLVTDGKTSEFPFAHHVHLDGSAGSIWEAHILRIGGDMLYRGWHAGYGDFRIITSYDTLAAETKGMSIGIIIPIKKVIEEIGERNRELKRWDFTPKVEASDTQGIVTFCISTRRLADSRKSRRPCASPLSRELRWKRSPRSPMSAKYISD